MNGWRERGKEGQKKGDTRKERCRKRASRPVTDYRGTRDTDMSVRYREGCQKEECEKGRDSRRVKVLERRQATECRKAERRVDVCERERERDG